MARPAKTVTAQETTQENVLQREDTVQSVELKRRALVKKYKAQEKMAVNISPLYKPHFGNTLTVSINGITVCIPCDGKTYQVPETHAIEAISRVRKVDTMLTRKDRMQRVSDNFETTPGEIKFY